MNKANIAVLFCLKKYPAAKVEDPITQSAENSRIPTTMKRSNKVRKVENIQRKHCILALLVLS